MSDKDAAMQQALDALLDLQSLDSQDVWLDRWSEAITALKAALEQPVQEPTQWRDMVVVTLAREGINKHRARELADHFAAQPVQEPIGEVVEVNNDGFKCEFSQHLPVGTKLYTTPPLPVQEPDRRALQAEGTHPAPCARHCEAKAFEIEIRGLKSALKQAQPEPPTCAWSPEDDDTMPGTYRSACGELWSFIDGGWQDNNVRFCHGCGGKVEAAHNIKEQKWHLRIT